MIHVTVPRAGATFVRSNPTLQVMRAMVLSLLGRLQWRHHGIGCLQGYVCEDTAPEVRVHLWSRCLVKDGMSVSGDAHDHRFDMISHVLWGDVIHEELIPTRDDNGDHGMMALTNARTAATTNYQGPTEKLDGRFSVTCIKHVVKSGESYYFPAANFHRSPVHGGFNEVAITVIEKHHQRPDRSRLIYPLAHEPVMAFGHEMDNAIVNQVVDRARGILKACLVPA